MDDGDGVFVGASHGAQRAVTEAVEQRRDAATCTAAVRAATRDLKVSIAAPAADAARGPGLHALAIGAQHTLDPFHVQRPLWQPLARPLVRGLEWPAAVLERAATRTMARHTRWREHQAGRRTVPTAERRAAHRARRGRRGGDPHLRQEWQGGVSDGGHRVVLLRRQPAALTVIHTHLLRHSDGTTAAERFFGLPPGRSL